MNKKYKLPESIKREIKNLFEKKNIKANLPALFDDLEVKIRLSFKQEKLAMSNEEKRRIKAEIERLINAIAQTNQKAIALIRVTPVTITKDDYLSCLFHGIPIPKTSTTIHVDPYMVLRACVQVMKLWTNKQGNSSLRHRHKDFFVVQIIGLFQQHTNKSAAYSATGPFVSFYDIVAKERFGGDHNRPERLIKKNLKLYKIKDREPALFNLIMDRYAFEISYLNSAKE